MRADLVGAARDQADPAQGKGPGGAQHVHIGDDLLAAFILRLVGMDADLVVLFVVLPPGREPPALGDAHGDGVVFLFEQVGADDLVHVPQGGVALGSDDKASVPRSSRLQMPGLKRFSPPASYSPSGPDTG